MDENYLDQLLKNVEHPDSGISEADISEEAELDMLDESEEELEQTLTADAAHVNDVSLSDAEIPTEEISELDELDKLADMDMDSMDFDDIDFDDIDVTKMNVNPVRFQKELEDLESLNIDETYLDESEDQAFEKEFQKMKEAPVELEDPDYVDTLSDVSTMMVEDSFSDMKDMEYVDTLTDTDSVTQPEAELSKKSEDKSFDVDSVFQEVFGDSEADMSQSEELEPVTETAENENRELETSSAQGSADDMDDLFAMLGIDATAVSSPPIPETDEIPDFEIPPELQDVADISDKKKKKSFMDILFGDDDEDALTPEQEAELAKEKEEKLQAKKAKKEQQKAQKAKDDAEKTARLAAKKAARKAEDERILAEDGPEKKLNKPLVVIIMIFFLAIGGCVIVGTGIFDYVLVVTKATDYFERQKYSMAYREILGAELREQDQELEDKIYTVMYVQRQYEAYENYVKMNRPDLALDALLKGLSKYDLYYDDAVALEIVEDLDTAKANIIAALDSTYGMKEDNAMELLQLDNAEYNQQIQALTANMDFSTESEHTVEDVTE